MKLIFLYGPPAVGKLTIAEKLSSMTGVPVFHNHLSRDIVKDIYKDVSSHYDLVNKIRTDVLGYCARNKTDLIFTFVYGGADDDEDAQLYVDSVVGNGGEVLFVELAADRDDLIERVTNESRTRYKKLTDPVVIEELTKSMENFSMPFAADALKINTSRVDPSEAAAIIARQFYEQ